MRWLVLVLVGLVTAQDTVYHYPHCLIKYDHGTIYNIYYYKSVNESRSDIYAIRTRWLITSPRIKDRLSDTSKVVLASSLVVVERIESTKDRYICIRCVFKKSRPSE